MPDVMPAHGITPRIPITAHKTENALREAAVGAVTTFDTLVELHNSTGDDILISALATAISNLREALK
jgi:hypothetical protein